MSSTDPDLDRSRAHALLWLVVDVLAPVAVYYLLHALGVGDVPALTVGGLIGGAGVVVQAVRNRRLDRLGLLVLGMFALTLALVAVTGDPRFVLAKPAVFTAAAGLYCLVTLFGERPLAYDTARPFAVGESPAAERRWERMWGTDPGMRSALRATTVYWAVGLLFEAVGRVLLTYSLPVPTAIWAVQLPGLVLILVMVATVLRMRGVRRRLRSAGNAVPATTA